MIIAIAVASAAVVASALYPVVKQALLRRSVLDVPVDRSSHSTDTVRGGGIAPLIAVVVGTSVLAIEDQSALLILPVVVGMGVLGLIEDLYGIRTAIRAGLQLVVSVLGVSVLMLHPEHEWWVLALGVVALAGFTNAANFMDGIDGISALTGAVVGVTFATLGLLAGEPVLAGAAIVFAVAFLAFLPWNVLGSKLFLGDVGSYTLGAVIAIIGILLVLAGVPPLAVVGPCAIYLADVTATLATRVKRGERWYEAHRSHSYQVLSDALGGHLRTALVVAALSALTGALGIASVVVPGLQTLFWLVMALVGIAYVVVVRLIVRNLRTAS